MTQLKLPLALTYDDVLLEPQYSEVLPHEVDTATQLLPSWPLALPLLSAAMDTVTESKMAIALARMGGIGVIHKNMTPQQQANQVLQVKKSESGMVLAPITIAPEASLAAARALMQQHQISGVPVVFCQKLIGILTMRDLRFAAADQTVADAMTAQVITAPPGTSHETAKMLLQQHCIEKLPIVNDQQHLLGLITLKDIEKKTEFPQAAVDARGSLKAAAAIGCGAQELERAAQLIASGVDMLVIDTAHGHSRGVMLMATQIKQLYPQITLMAGNVATAAGTQALADVGVDIVKVGMGPGSICTTRIVTGNGVPQLTAVLNCAQAAAKHHITIIADGGIRYSGDIVKALAAGAAAVMVGSLLAGTDEAPGEVILYQGHNVKKIRGMGSLEAMQQGSADRYFQSADSPFIPQGVEGLVPTKGRLATVIQQLTGGLRAGMGYIGAANLAQLRSKARFVRISPAAMRESHVHDVLITKEAPNYRL